MIVAKKSIIWNRSVEKDHMQKYDVDPKSDKLVIELDGHHFYYNTTNDIYYVVYPDNTVHHEYASEVLTLLNRLIFENKCKSDILDCFSELKRIKEDSKKINEKWHHHEKLTIEVDDGDDVFTSYTNECGAIPTSCGPENKDKTVIIVVKNNNASGLSRFGKLNIFGEQLQK
jgi:hypothetical protein